jgi:uncharacterized protein YpmB
MFKKFLKLIGIILLIFIIIVFFSFLIELKQNNGNTTKATVGILKKVANAVTDLEPIYVLLLGINDDLSRELNRYNNGFRL